MITRAEDISMNSFPTAIIFCKVLPIPFALGISHIVQTEGSNHDQRHQSRQKHNNHKTIKNTKPMNLRFEEIVF